MCQGPWRGKLCEPDGKIRRHSRREEEGAALIEASRLLTALFVTGAADTIMTEVWMVATALISALFVRFYASIYDRGRVAEGAAAEDEGASSEAFWQKKEVSIYDLL